MIGPDAAPDARPDPIKLNQIVGPDVSLEHDLFRKPVSAFRDHDLVRGIAFCCAALLQEHLAEMRNGMRQHVGLIFFRHEGEDGIRQTLGDPRHEISDIRRLGLFDVLLHNVVDVAVKAIRHEITRSVTQGLGVYVVIKV
jgi:hypothetical protein